MKTLIEVGPLIIAFVSGFSVGTVLWIVLGFLIAKSTKTPIHDLTN